MALNLRETLAVLFVKVYDALKKLATKKVKLQTVSYMKNIDIRLGQKHFP